MDTKKKTDLFNHRTCPVCDRFSGTEGCAWRTWSNGNRYFVMDGILVGNTASQPDSYSIPSGWY